MRVWIGISLLVAACAPPSATRFVSLRPLIVSHRAGDLHIFVNGQPWTEETEWSTSYTTADDAHRAKIRVELDDATGPIARADIVPFELCADLARRSGTPAAPAPTSDDFISQSMEVFLIDPQDANEMLTDGPCIDCELTDETGVGACGGGAVSQPVAP